MTNKKENTQRVLGNHGNITQNGDIIEFKNSKIENINNILIQNLENSIIELQYNEGVLKNEKEILTKLLSLNDNNFDFLRFLFSFLVVIGHSILLSGNPEFWNGFFAAMPNFSVYSFFIISGFLK